MSYGLSHLVFPRKPVSVLTTDYCFPVLINCYLGGILGEARKDSRFYHFFFRSILSSYSTQTHGWRTYFYESLCERQHVRHTGKWDAWESDVWKQKVPVISSGQAPRPIKAGARSGRERLLDGTRCPGSSLLPAAPFPQQAYENQMELVNICFQIQIVNDREYKKLMKL